MPVYGREGYGYYNCEVHPIGGEFHRFGRNEPITEMVPLYRPYKGCTHYAILHREGKRIKIACGEICTETREV